MPNLDQECPRAPYLLCACRVGSFSGANRCRKGATQIRDGYAVCAEHSGAKNLKLHTNAVAYKFLEPMIDDQFSRSLKSSDQE